jgi:hypothetical protein
MRAYIFPLFILVSSCSDVKLKEEGSILSEVYRNGLLHEQYTYDGDSVKSYVWYDSDGNPIISDDYQYVGDTVIISRFNRNNVLFEYHKLYKVDEANSRTDNYNPNHNLIGYIIYKFNGDQCGFISTDYYFANDELDSSFPRKYLDTRCSYESVRTKTDGSLGRKAIKTRDEFNYSHHSTILDFYRAPLSGNIVEAVELMSDDSIDIYASYSSVFEYNLSRYPILETKTYEYGETIEFTYKYLKE